jgi:hypothetical protein
MLPVRTAIDAIRNKKNRSNAVVTASAYVGAIVVLFGLALSAFAVYLADGRDEPQYRDH